MTLENVMTFLSVVILLSLVASLTVGALFVARFVLWPVACGVWRAMQLAARDHHDD